MLLKSVHKEKNSTIELQNKKEQVNLDLSRKVNLDILKIIACFLVIVNHTNSRIFLYTKPSITWFLSVIYFFICKIAVPIFIMASGAVLLKKEESYIVLYRKRILKILIVIIGFSFVYYLNYILMNSQSFSIYKFFYTIWCKPGTNAYWYLYMYLGLLIMLPILRKMVKNLEPKDYIYSFIIWSIFIGSMPIINHYFSIKEISNFFSLPIFTGYVVYFIIGHFIENKLKRKFFNKTITIILIIISILCIALSVGLTYYEYINKGNIKFMDNISFITISIPSISVFYICKYMVLKYRNINKFKIITRISECTFGIYLISDLLIEKMDYIYKYCKIFMNPLIAVFILEISIFISGLIITKILKKIPLIKKII